MLLHEYHDIQAETITPQRYTNQGQGGRKRCQFKYDE